MAMANAWDYLQKRSAILSDLNSVPLPINMLFILLEIEPMSIIQYIDIGSIYRA